MLSGPVLAQRGTTCPHGAIGGQPQPGNGGGSKAERHAEATP